MCNFIIFADLVEINHAFLKVYDELYFSLKRVAGQ